MYEIHYHYHQTDVNNDQSCLLHIYIELLFFRCLMFVFHFNLHARQAKTQNPVNIHQAKLIFISIFEIFFQYFLSCFIY